ncbi:MAG: tRNA uridine-5-carboxymethylaminomethyl(34) synthesis GTPase MnmE, partial [candidate division Zixibacteria bacterium]|nr:tRNA uridine-5-carboxymethylaminomethyl(34) synthesis GTPase MnmE [candidate division Zixibacteria bacterium]
ALAIIRLSGKKAFAVAGSVFQGGVKISEAPSHTIHHGFIVDPASKEKIDEVLVSVFRAPKSYTAEDSVEISGHGGRAVVSAIVEALVRAGARPAQPGEFTQRAFLNGRIDLAQAEAVADLISARSDASRRSSLEQLEGHLSKKVNLLRESLLDVLAEVEANLDFPEEGIEPERSEQISQTLTKVITQVRTLAKSFKEGRILREGYSVVIVGRPNVGKSSLLNALLQKDRAIVTPLPGTTRDTIEEWALFSGVPVRLVDTAGLRERGGKIEKEGMRRTEEAIEKSDLVLLMLDASQKLNDEDRQLLGKYEGRKKLMLYNKVDLLSQVPSSTESNTSVSLGVNGALYISATLGTGLGRLKEKIARMAVPSFGTEQVLVTSARHKEALAKGFVYLLRARRGLERGKGLELVAFELRRAVNALGEITGEIVTEDILGRIFSKFCVGK